MDIPTRQFTQQEFDSLPVSESTAHDQSRCRAKAKTGQWLYIDKDNPPHLAVIEIVPADGKVLLFILPQSNATVHQSEPQAPANFDAREPVPAAVTDIEKAKAAFATLTGCVLEMRARVETLVAGVRMLPPQLQTRRNKKVVVFADAVEDVAELLDKQLPLQPEAVEWWNNRNGEMTEAKQMRTDLRVVDDLVAELEKETGAEPLPGADKLRPIEKLADITAAMLETMRTLAGMNEQLEKQVAALKQKN